MVNNTKDGTNKNTSITSSVPNVINITDFTSRYPKFKIRHLQHLALRDGIVIYGRATDPRNSSYIPAPLTDSPALYLPDKYVINTPDKLVNAVSELLLRLGVNINRRFNYSVEVMLVKINWSTYGFDNNDTVDYIWYTRVIIHNGSWYTPGNSHFFLSAGFSALTGAVIRLSLTQNDFYTILDKYTDLIVNKTWFYYIIEQHRFDNEREAYKFFMDIFKVLNINLEIYGHNYTFYFNTSYPAHTTVIFQAIDGKTIINTGINLYQIGMFNAVNLFYHKNLGTGEVRLSSIFVSLMPLKYTKIIKYNGNIDLNSIITYGQFYIKRRFNLSSNIPVSYTKSDRVFYLVAPWALKEFILVSYNVKAGNEAIIMLVIEPSSMEVYDYVILPTIIST